MSTSTPPPPPVSHSEQQQPAGLQPPTQAVFTPVALVTAGSAGLGAAIVRRFAAAGLSVVINYAHNRDRAVGLATELHERYGSPGGGAVGDERKQDQGGKLEQEQEPEQKQRFVVIEADMAERASIEHLVRVTLAALGRLDVVVSNAGWTPFAPFDVLENALDEGDWDRCFGVNVKSCFWLMAAAREALEESSRRAEEEEKEEKEEQGKGYRGEVVGVRGGCFVSTASLSGVRPGGSSLAYSVTKAALIHLIKSLAVICGPQIRVNCVSPGLLLTEWGQQFSEEKINAAIDKAALKRAPTVEDVALQVLCFAQSRSITGQNVMVDCGTVV